MMKTLDFGIFGGVKEVREITDAECKNDSNWTGFCLDESGKYHLMYNLETDEYGYMPA